MPKVSVVMPVFNGERYVAAAIESILAQTEDDFEFIVFDDASDDHTVNIAKQYAARDRRIRIEAGRRNRGAATRLNQGIDLARAPVIAHMDADDISMPQRLETQLRRLSDRPDLVLLGSKVVVIDPDGDPLAVMGGALTHEEIDSGLMSRTGQLVYQPTIVYRKSAAKDVGGYNEDYSAAQDLDFFLKMAEAGRIENLPEPLLQYRRHFAAAGYARIAEQERAIDHALAAARRRRRLPPPNEDEAQAQSASRRTTASHADTHRTWGWWALSGGWPKTARKHALKAFAQEPLSPDSAKLLFCSLRGH